MDAGDYVEVIFIAGTEDEWECWELFAICSIPHDFEQQLKRGVLQHELKSMAVSSLSGQGQCSGPKSKRR